MSPLSKGLFQKGISESGTNLDPWAQPAHHSVAPTRAAKLGEIVGCRKNGNDWSEMIKCLRTVDAADITKAFYDFFVSFLFVVVVFAVQIFFMKRKEIPTKQTLIRTKISSQLFPSSVTNSQRLFLFYLA